MLMYHATPWRNWRNIKRYGLLARKSRGRMRTVWLCTQSVMPLSVAHAVRRHGTNPEHVAIIEVDVPRSILKKYRKGWKHTGGVDVRPEQVRRVLAIVEVA